jgi:hypothetical protein
MHWSTGRAEAVVHLRCIELNGDWDPSIAWNQQQYQKRLRDRQAVLIRYAEPLKCDFGLAV